MVKNITMVVTIIFKINPIVSEPFPRLRKRFRPTCDDVYFFGTTFAGRK